MGVYKEDKTQIQDRHYIRTTDILWLFLLVDRELCPGPSERQPFSNMAVWMQLPLSWFHTETMFPLDKSWQKKSQVIGFLGVILIRQHWPFYAPMDAG